MNSKHAGRRRFLKDSAALAQAPDYRGVGKTPSQQEIKAWDIAIGLDSKELPPGSGTAQQGAPWQRRRQLVA